MNRYWLKCWVMMLGVFTNTVLYAQTSTPKDAHTEITAGVHYRVLDLPQEHRSLVADLRTESQGKVLILEFFSYGCAGCFFLESSLAEWRMHLSKDIGFKRIPVLFHQQWSPYSKAFYTLEALQAQVVEGALFQAIHQLKKPLLQDTEMIHFLQEQAPTHQQAIKELYHSFSVDKQMRTAVEQAKFFRVTMIPQILVVGKDQVIAIENRLPGGAREMLAVTAKVLEKQLKNSD